MAVKRTVAKKTTAKKSVPTKRTAPAKTADSDPTSSVVDKMVTAIQNGNFDGHLEKFEDALIHRMNSYKKDKENAVAKKTVSKSPDEKKVSVAPKRDPKPSVELENGKTYLVTSGLKGIGGAKVKFHRFKANTNEVKSVVEMLEDKPGNPIGKRIVIPSNALEDAPVKRAAARRRVKK